MFRRRPDLPVAGIYLLYGPTLYAEPRFGLDTSFTVEDHQQAALVIEHVKAWCLRNGFLTRSGAVALNRGEASLVTYLHNLNFRTLVDAATLDSVMAFLRDNDVDRTMSRILSLHTSLLTVGDSGYLTKLINKLYHGLTLVSPPGDHTWPEIHQRIPYLWVLWLIQLVLHQHSPSIFPDSDA